MAKFTVHKVLDGQYDIRRGGARIGCVFGEGAHWNGKSGGAIVVSGVKTKYLAAAEVNLAWTSKTLKNPS